MIAGALRWWSRGAFNHVGVLDESTGLFYEARELKGVQVRFWEAVKLDLEESGATWKAFEVPALSYGQGLALRDFLRAQCGKRYDYLGVIRFVSRRPMPASSFDRRWFCSELIADAFAQVGLPLLNAPGWKISPETLSYSPKLKAI